MKKILTKLTNHIYAWAFPSKAMLLKGKLVTIIHCDTYVDYFLINEADELNLPDDKKFVEKDVNALIEKLNSMKIQDGGIVYIYLMQYLRKNHKTHLSYEYKYQRRGGNFVFLKKSRTWD